MAKYYYIFKKNLWRESVNLLTERFALPYINHCLAIYFKKDEHVFEVNFRNNKCAIRSYNKSISMKDKYLASNASIPAITIDNNNIKYLLKIFSQLQLNNALINRIVSMDYEHEGEIFATIQIGTVAGDLLVIDQKYEEKIASLLEFDRYFSKKLTISELDTLIDEKYSVTEPVFCNYDIPNRVIRNFADQFSISLNSGINTISHKISAKSNNYDIYDDYFALLTGSQLDADEPQVVIEKHFKPMSIIISSYNSENTILSVLRSIQSQELSDEQKKNLDVIVVDDGSQKNVCQLLDPHLSEFSFSPIIVRLEKNKGLSFARNLGIQMSKYEHILFIDSDILLSKNYLYEHSIRLQTIPNGVFISFKENISPESELLYNGSISKGLPISTNLNDKRLSRLVDNDIRWKNRTVNEGIIEILSETDRLKNFGYGRSINGCYDLPSMVVGHNMSMRKEIANLVGGFSNHFSGWGLEDAFFGAKAIAQGNFVIPVLTTSVYHIDHPSRSGSIEKQLKEHELNTEIYNSLIRLTI